jgi:hypothetical protein
VQISCKQMVNFEPSDYGNMMWAFAKFNYSPGEQFFTTVSHPAIHPTADLAYAAFWWLYLGVHAGGPSQR